ncbi:membrane integrity-associated transporter subunit PqiC [candidate division KSB1 bacterium]|nr:membrane integrity-associated transporter subunit PqiC [candidate division KSB1 bacterium]
MKIYRFIGVISLLVLACAHAPQTRYYQLALSFPDSAEPSRMLPLYIKPFSAVSPYQQNRFVYRVSSYEVQFDAYRRWIAAPAELLYDSAVDYFRSVGAFSQVSTVLPEGPHYRLSATIQEFDEIQIGSDHLARVALWVELFDPDGLPLLQRRFVQQKPIHQSSVSGILAALSLATETLFAEIDEHIGSVIR